MNILLLAEGNAETRDSWSGITKSVLDHLRSAGHTVRVADVELYRAQRWLTAGRTFSPNRDRWRVKYRLGRAAFESRTRNSGRHVELWRRQVDVILQIGATFEPRGRGSVPYALYCDSNIRMAEHGAQSGHTHAVHLTERERRAVRSREAAVYKHASIIFTMNDRLRRSFMEDFGIEADRVRTIYAGPNLQLAPDPERRRQLQQDCNPTVLFVGRQFKRKGGDLLLEAFGRVRKRIPNAQLFIVGPSRGDQIPGVRWLGHLNPDDRSQRGDLVAAYTAADVFCLPTQFEPFGIVFLEAMGFGLPCIGTNAWAIPEIIIDGETGYTVPTNDTEALASRLLCLLGNRQRARTMGEAGRQRLIKYFTWRAVIARIIESLESIAANRRTHG